MFRGLGFRGLGCRGSGFRVQGLRAQGLRAQGLGFRVFRSRASSDRAYYANGLKGGSMSVAAAFR